MSLEHLPLALEQGIQRFAAHQHISQDEAVIKLIETGLVALKQMPQSVAGANNNVAIPGLSGDPMSDEDAAVIDEIVAEAMALRRQRWKQDLRA